MVKEVNMDTSSTIKRLLGEYEKIRTENQREGQRREREIRQGFPAIAALLNASLRNVPPCTTMCRPSSCGPEQRMTL